MNLHLAPFIVFARAMMSDSESIKKSKSLLVHDRHDETIQVCLTIKIL